MMLAYQFRTKKFKAERRKTSVRSKAGILSLVEGASLVVILCRDQVVTNMRHCLPLPNSLSDYLCY